MKELLGKKAAVRCGGELRAGGFKIAWIAMKRVVFLTSVLLPCAAAPAGDAMLASDHPTPFAVNCAWNTLTAATTLIRNYENERQARFIDFTPIDSEQVLGRLRHNECGVGIVFDSFVPEKGKELAHAPKSAVIARYVVGVAVNAKNPVRIVTFEDLRKIFAAYPNDPRPIRSWKNVSGSEYGATTEFVRPQKGSALAEFFQERVLQGCVFSDEWMAPTVRSHCEKKSDAEVIGAIAKQPNAIGFFLQGGEKVLDKRVRVLGICKSKGSPAVFPTATTIADGSYPLTDSLTLYLQPAAPKSARDFCKFAIGEEGARIVKQCGLWPEYELNEVRGVKRLKDVKTHRGVEIGVSGNAAWQPLIKDLGGEFSKAKTAVEIEYRPMTQGEAVGRFVAAGEDEREKGGKGEGAKGERTDETNGP